VVSGNGCHRRSLYYISWWCRIKVQFRRYRVYHRWETSNETIEFLEILMWASQQNNALSLTIYTMRIAVFGLTARAMLLRTRWVSFSIKNETNLIRGLIWWSSRYTHACVMEHLYLASEEGDPTQHIFCYHLDYGYCHHSSSHRQHSQ
jgi:hypothetical protein